MKIDDADALKAWLIDVLTPLCAASLDPSPMPACPRSHPPSPHVPVQLGRRSVDAGRVRDRAAGEGQVRGWVLQDEGPLEEVEQNELVREAYLGR